MTSLASFPIIVALVAALADPEVAFAPAVQLAADGAADATTRTPRARPTADRRARRARQRRIGEAAHQRRRARAEPIGARGQAGAPVAPLRRGGGALSRGAGVGRAHRHARRRSRRAAIWPGPRAL